jgi:hypothetical protein
VEGAWKGVRKVRGRCGRGVKGAWKGAWKGVLKGREGGVEGGVEGAGETLSASDDKEPSLKWKARYNRTTHISHQCRKTIDLNCHRCLINTCVEKM